LVSAVSGRSVIVRDVPMPDMPIDELRTALQFEADKYIPFETADVTMDCQKLETSASPEGAQQREIKVRLVAVKRSVLDDHIRVLNEAGLKPFIVDYDSFALGNAFELQQILRGLELGKEAVALVDIGQTKTSINIVKGDRSLFTREVYVAGQDLTNAIGQRLSLEGAELETVKRNPGDRLNQLTEAVSTTVDDLGNEMSLSLDYFENQFDDKVGAIYVSGGGSLLPGVVDKFASLFDRQTLTWDPTEGIPIGSSKVADLQLTELGPKLAIALGLAARIYEG
jgi:type IV pilus assembly protein PilM